MSPPKTHTAFPPTSFDLVLLFQACKGSSYLIDPNAFVLETFPDGSVLFDVPSGLLFQLNPSAAFVWSQTLAGADTFSLVAEVSRKFGVDSDVARLDIESALRTSSTTELPSQSHGFSYQRVDDVYRFSFEGAPVLEVLPTGDCLRRVWNASDDAVSGALSALSPKLMALRGECVLHASAVRRPDGQIVAFLGESGAGKTTTATAFARAGWPLISEDKLILSKTGKGILAILQGEGSLASWVSQMRGHLMKAAPMQWLQLPPFSLDIRSSILCETIFLSSSHRRGERLSLWPIGQAAAMSLLFQNTFLGSWDPQSWKRTVKTLCAVARETHAFGCDTPAGVDHLDVAVRDYTLKTAS